MAASGGRGLLGPWEAIGHVQFSAFCTLTRRCWTQWYPLCRAVAYEESFGTPDSVEGKVVGVLSKPFHILTQPSCALLLSILCTLVGREMSRGSCKWTLPEIIRMGILIFLASLRILDLAVGEHIAVPASFVHCRSLWKMAFNPLVQLCRTLTGLLRGRRLGLFVPHGQVQMSLGQELFSSFQATCSSFW